MVKIFILIIFLLSGCLQNQVKKNNKPAEIIFSDSLSIEDFEKKLEIYAQNKSYPNIDN